MKKDISYQNKYRVNKNALVKLYLLQESNQLKIFNMIKSMMVFLEVTL